MHLYQDEEQLYEDDECDGEEVQVVLVDVGLSEEEEGVEGDESCLHDAVEESLAYFVAEVVFGEMDDVVEDDGGVEGVLG